MLTDVVAALESRLPGRIIRNAPLSDFTTYRLGGPVVVLVRARSVDDILDAGDVIPPEVPVLVVGRGSNLLVADRGFDGVALHLEDELEALEVRDERGPAEQGHAVVGAGGGLALPVLARRTAGAGWTGLEFFVGIPGTVGGAVRMNAGGHGHDTAAVLREALVVEIGNPEPRWWSATDLDFSYRHSGIGPRHVVVGTTFAVVADGVPACEARVAEIVRWRREHQPGGSNAGSVFTNPPGDSAGRLIDACGLKGLRVGGAAVSEKHANFFQADPGATATDVADLVAAVQRRVADQTGITLVPELRMIGFE